MYGVNGETASMTSGNGTTAWKAPTLVTIIMLYNYAAAQVGFVHLYIMHNNILYGDSWSPVIGEVLV